MPKSPYPSWQRRHEAVLQFILQNPSAKHAQCAAATGYSEWQISRITHSPEFQRRYQKLIEVKYEKWAEREAERIERIVEQTRLPKTGDTAGELFPR
jgi:hypothetical protein